ncbi:MAG: DUF4432 domain-containing protein, partial [Clostridiales bacterium]|nr:DUF4432 domain-containing protein [Clostridiales bacterium]
MNDMIRRGYISRTGQLFGVRRVECLDGQEKGNTILEVYTAGGLRVEILPDHGLDIGQAWYRGINMTYISKNGYDHPYRDMPYEDEFLHYFPGGLLYTCGLRSAGPANRDNGEWHPLHGRYHSICAEEVCSAVTDDEIIISGVIRETALFGYVLENRRTIRIPACGASVTIEDRITNMTPRDEEIMQIYHCNFGYPLLSEKAVLELPEKRETVPRTPFAETGLARACEFDKPADGEEERVFFQKMEEEFRASVINPGIGVRMNMTWSGETLPILSEWRSMASGDYVLGLEPTNCYIMGR